MKRLAALLVLLGFAGMAVFGFAIIMHPMSRDSSGDCLAGVVTNSACPTDGVNMADHHISAFQFFSSAALSAPLALLAVALFFGVVGYMLFVPSARLVRHRFFARLRHKYRSNYFTAVAVFSVWLSRFQFSPSF